MYAKERGEVSLDVILNPFSFHTTDVHRYKVIALKTRKVCTLKARTMFATKFVLDLNARVATMGDGR
jgi:hypothetical protein